jgi:hypothetical protein
MSASRGDGRSRWDEAGERSYGGRPEVAECARQVRFGDRLASTRAFRSSHPGSLPSSNHRHRIAAKTSAKGAGQDDEPSWGQTYHPRREPFGSISVKSVQKLAQGPLIAESWTRRSASSATRKRVRSSSERCCLRFTPDDLSSQPCSSQTSPSASMAKVPLQLSPTAFVRRITGRGSVSNDDREDDAAGARENGWNAHAEQRAIARTARARLEVIALVQATGSEPIRYVTGLALSPQPRGLSIAIGGSRGGQGPVIHLLRLETPCGPTSLIHTPSKGKPCAIVLVGDGLAPPQAKKPAVADRRLSDREVLVQGGGGSSAHDASHASHAVRLDHRLSEALRSFAAA